MIFSIELREPILLFSTRFNFFDNYGSLKFTILFFNYFLEGIFFKDNPLKGMGGGRRGLSIMLQPLG